MHLHAEGGKGGDGIPADGREGGLTAGLAVQYAGEKRGVRWEKERCTGQLVL